MAKKKSSRPGPNGKNLYPEILGRRYEVPFVIARDAPIDTEKRTVELSISSDQPVDHWFGRIILDHSASSVRLERIRAGAPLLLNHDVDQQIGVLENIKIEDGKLRAVARFSRSQLAGEIFQDVQDGIRRNTSVGFILHEMDLEQKSDKGPNVYRARDWEPLEGSIASVPRDISVGVGRAMGDDESEAADDQDEEETQSDTSDEDEEETASSDRAARTIKPTKIQVRSIMKPETVAGNGGGNAPNPLDAMLERSTRYVTFAIGFGTTDERRTELEEMARDFALSEKSESDLFAAINEKRGTWAKVAIPPAAPLVDLTASDKQKYSIARAIIADANGRDRDYHGGLTSCFELEISQEIERKLDAPGAKKHGGFYMPTNIALRGQILQRAGLDSKTATKGAELVFTEAGSFIEMLRNKAMVMILGATVLPGLQGNVAFPRQTGAGSFSWVGENPGADVGESNLLLDQVTLSPKTGQSTTSYSRQLLAQGVTNVDSLVQNDLVEVNALAIDLAALHGLGSANQPRGIYNLTGVNAVPMGGALAFGPVVDLETAIGVSNAEVGVMAYLMTPEIRGKAKQRPVLANTIALPIWMNGEVNGYRAEATNQLAKNLGAGTNEHGIIFGVWSQLLIGEWGALEIITDPYRLKKQGMIEVTSFVMVDVNARYAQAFSKGTGLLNT